MERIAVFEKVSRKQFGKAFITDTPSCLCFLRWEVREAMLTEKTELVWRRHFSKLMR